MAPSLSATDTGAVLSWLEPVDPEQRSAGSPWRLRWARWDRQGGWGDAGTVVERSDLFINWADVPSVITAGDGSLLAHWLQKSGPATYAYDIQLARSTDGGRTWASLGTLHDDATPTEHGFVSFIPGSGSTWAFWLDGRNTGGGHADEGEAGAGAMTLRAAQVFGADIRDSVEIDPRVCDCCPTAAAMTSRGPVVVYRDRGEGELRDISIIRREGDKWTAPAMVWADGWTYPACPVNGPAVAAAGERVAVAWYTEAAPGPRIVLAYSDDAGATFRPPVLIEAAVRGASAPLGRVGIVMMDNGDTVVSWLTTRGGDSKEATVRLVRITASGKRGQDVIVGRTSASRMGGVPRVSRIREKLVVAWTDAGKPSQVRAAVLDASSVP